jgi:hypothetical protein
MLTVPGKHQQADYLRRHAGRNRIGKRADPTWLRKTCRGTRSALRTAAARRGARDLRLEP